MIVEAVFNVIIALLVATINVFPTIPKVDTSFLDGVFQVLSLIDTFLSVKLLAGCFVVVFIFMQAEILWGIVMWVVKKIPGVE